MEQEQAMKNALFAKARNAGSGKWSAAGTEHSGGTS
jgi:hypothetical protein